MKIILTLTFLIWSAFCLSIGYIWYDKIDDGMLSGVRGGARTGFHLLSGENIAIGTSSPVLANLHVYETSTTSIAIDGTAMGCIRMLDTDSGGYTNIATLNGSIVFVSDSNCGF